jgi:hypothetical protein
MSHAEDRMADRIDRSRGRTSNAARFAELDRMASCAVALPLDSREDAVTFLRLVVGHAFARLLGFDTRHQTRAYFGRLASGDDFRSLAKSAAWADQQWAEVTKPANDDGDA